MTLIPRGKTSLRLGLAAGLTASLALAAPFLQAQGAWKTLFNGKDLSGWVVLAGAGRAGAPPPTTPPSMNLTDRGWKVENGVITSTPAAAGQRTASLSTADSYKDFELEFDFMLSEAGTKCSEKLGDKQANLSEDKTCTFNSGVQFRSGYQLNLGRREAGEYIGVVVHRQVPFAIRGNVAWLSTGDCGAKNNTYLQDCSQFKELRKKGDWNTVRLSFKGAHLQAWLNGTQITDLMDNVTDPAEASWKEAGPIYFQFPPAGESGGFAGTVKYRNIRIRTL